MVNAGDGRDDGAGFCVFAHQEETAAWANAAHDAALHIARDPAIRAANLRHGNTWFVGVDALPNDPDGSIAGVPLAGRWGSQIAPPATWHPAQLSIVYPGYPQLDPAETDANHRYRITRKAAHVDGLLPVGSARRRYLREAHAFILGLPLTRSDASPLMVWPGSHRIMGAAFRQAVGRNAPCEIDLTDAYHAARRAVFDQITPVAVCARPGQAVLLHRHLLHGVEVWHQGALAPAEGRMIAYFRPVFSAADWLA